MPFWTSQRPQLADPPAVQIRWTPSDVTAPADPVVDLNTVKTFINRPLEDTFWDDEIRSFLRVAERTIEQFCQLTLSHGSYVGTLPAFYPRIKINKRPFTNVTGIDYVEHSTGEIKTVATSVYGVAPLAQDCGMVFLGDAQEWPDAARRMDAVRITITAGFPDGLPDDLLHALLMTVAALDKGRGDDSGSGGRMTVYAMKQATSGRSIIPIEARSLLAPYIYRSVTV